MALSISRPREATPIEGIVRICDYYHGGVQTCRERQEMSSSYVMEENFHSS